MKLKTKNILLVAIALIATLLISINIFNIYDNYKNTTYLADYIKEKNNNNNIFQGNVTSNYVLFNNLTWRIIKINNDSTITMILDDYINVLPQNDTKKTFETLYNNLDKKVLVKNKICLNNIEDDNNIKCNILKNEEYINLLSAYDYFNSFKNEESFITKKDEKIWLNNENTIAINNKISNVDNTNPYEIRPVITINNNILYTEGDGTITNPYKIGVSTLSLGSKVSKDNNKYIVIDATNNYKLLSEKVIENIIYDEVNDYLNNLINYKNIIEKIYIPSLNDIKLDNTYTDYYLQDKINNFNIAYGKEITYIDKSKKHNTRYIIEVSKKNITEFKYEN